MAKLTKDNRDAVKMGTILTYGCTTYQVLRVEEVRNNWGDVIGKSIVAVWLDCSNKALIGRTCREKLSFFYGDEIKNEDEATRKANNADRFAERYGITSYKAEDNTLTYYETFTRDKTTYKCTVDLTTGEEKRQRMTRYYKPGAHIGKCEVVRGNL